MRSGDMQRGLQYAHGDDCPQKKMHLHPEEWLLRAKKTGEGLFPKGLLTTVKETRLTAKGLSRLIDEAFDSGYRPAARVNTDGLKNTISIVQDLLSSSAGGILPSHHAL